MNTPRRKLTLSTETVRWLLPDELARVDGGNIIRDTQQNSCHGISCDPSCNGLCATLPKGP